MNNNNPWNSTTPNSNGGQFYGAWGAGSPYGFSPTSPSPQPKLVFPKWFLPVIIALGGILIVVLVIAIVKNNDEDSLLPDEEELIAQAREEDQADLDAYENAIGEKDSLNPDYKVAVDKNPYATYETELERTKLAEYLPYEVCSLLNVSCSALSDPDSLSGFEKVEALNTNALSYYLDNGHVVIISADGDYPYSESNVVVVFAGDYTWGHRFYTFFPPNGIEDPMPLEFRRGDLINHISNVPNCYVSKGTF